MARIDLDSRVAVVRVHDDGTTSFPHALRGSLAGMLTDTGWHVVLAFQPEVPDRAEVTEVLDQARGWAAENGCRLSVAAFRDVRDVTSLDA